MKTTTTTTTATASAPPSAPPPATAEANHDLKIVQESNQVQQEIEKLL